MRTSKLSTLAAAVLLLGGTNLAIAAGHKGRSESATAMGRGDLKSFAGRTRGIGTAAPPSAARQRKAQPEAKSSPHKRAAYPRGKKQSLGSRIASTTRIIGVAAMCGRRAARQRNLHPEAKPRPHTSLAVNAGQVGLFGLARAVGRSVHGFVQGRVRPTYMLSRSREFGAEPFVLVRASFRPGEGQPEWVGRT